MGSAHSSVLKQTEYDFPGTKVKLLGGVAGLSRGVTHGTKIRIQFVLSRALTCGLNTYFKSATFVADLNRSIMHRDPLLPAEADIKLDAYTLANVAWVVRERATVTSKTVAFDAVVQTTDGGKYDFASASAYMAVCIHRHLRAGSIPVFPHASMGFDAWADVNLLKFSM
jgi:hypothetical protein